MTRTGPLGLVTSGSCVDLGPALMQSAVSSVTLTVEDRAQQATFGCLLSEASRLNFLIDHKGAAPSLINTIFLTFAQDTSPLWGGLLGCLFVCFDFQIMATEQHFCKSVLSVFPVVCC